MIKTIILGSGNLSNELNKKIIGSKIYTAKNFIKKISSINNNKKINLIINSFYSAVKLKKLLHMELLLISQFLKLQKFWIY